MTRLHFNLTARDEVSPVLDKIKKSQAEMAQKGQTKVSRATEAPRRQMGQMSGGGPGALFPRGGAKGGGGGEAGGMTGILGKGAGGMMGSLAAITIVAEGILKGIQAVIGFLTEASPMLKGVLHMLKIGVMLILKPLGDMLAMVLMPLARFLLQFQAKYAKQYGEAMKEGNIGGMMDIFIVMIQDLAGQIWDALVKAIQEADWVAIFVGIGETIYNIMVWWYKSLGEVIFGVMKWIGEQLFNLFTGLITWLGENLAKIPGLIWDALAGLGTWIWNGIIGALAGLGDILGKFGQWLWDSITGAITGLANILGGFASWLWNSITGAITGLGDILGKFGQWLWDQITGALSGVGDFLGDIGGSISDTLGIHGDLIPGLHLFAEGGIVTRPTAGIVGEAGPEAVIPLDKMGKNSVMPVEINIHVNGPIYGVNDIQRAIEEGIDEYAMRLRLA